MRASLLMREFHPHRKGRFEIHPYRQWIQLIFEIPCISSHFLAFARGALTLTLSLRER